MSNCSTSGLRGSCVKIYLNVTWKVNYQQTVLIGGFIGEENATTNIQIPIKIASDPENINNRQTNFAKTIPEHLDVECSCPTVISLDECSDVSIKKKQVTS